MQQLKPNLAVLLQPSQPGFALVTLPADRSTATKPALVDRGADFEIPGLLWSHWKEEGKERSVRRPLSTAELGTMQVRANSLRLATIEFAHHEEDLAITAISSMLGGFRSMRQGEQEAAALLDGLRRVLAPFPLWAIEQGCLLIHRGEAVIDGRKMDRRYPPNDSEIYGVINEIVKPYLQALENAEALLTAPVES